MKGTAQQEKDVFGQIADSRAKLAGAHDAGAADAGGQRAEHGAARLLVVVENYPELKSNASFNRLMDELAGTENRLAVARMRYNEQVQAYNTSRRQFPSNVTAGIFGFKEHPLFNAPPEAERVPKVNFGNKSVGGRRGEMPFVDSLLPEFDHEMSITRKVLERVPDDRFDWKPHAKSYAAGQLAQHLATIPWWGTMTLSEAGDRSRAVSSPGAAAGVGRGADALRHATRRARARRWSARSDAELKAPWSLKREGHVIFSMPKHAVWRSFVISHMIHHRAQLGVYLRLLDVPVPSTYGPSADEGGL